MRVAVKDSVANWLRAISTRAMPLVAMGIATGLVVGIGAGYKIEQNRTQSDVSRLKAQIKQIKHAKSGTTNVAVKRSGPFNQRLGTVTAVGADTIRVATKRLGVVQLHSTSATHFERASLGTKTDITIGRRALLTLSGDVLVLARGSLLGRPITKVASDSFSITKAVGIGTATISFAKVKVIDTTSAVTRSDIKTGTVVLAGGHAAGQRLFDAAEVIVIPAASGFAR